MKTINKKAGFNYKLEPERFEAGVVLSGDEAKAAKINKVDLSSSHAKIMGNEVWLIGVNIAGSSEPTRTRKLLLKRSQIVSIGSKMKQRRLTFVPVSMYTKGRLVKVKLALGKSKRKSDKRRSLKEKDLKRQVEKELKGTY